jgi:hypothetical protein
MESRPNRPDRSRSVTADDIEQPLRDMGSEIGVNAYQVSIESGMEIFVNGRPFEITGCPTCSSASMTLWAASSSRGSGKWEIAHYPR